MLLHGKGELRKRHGLLQLGDPREAALLEPFGWEQPVVDAVVRGAAEGRRETQLEHHERLRRARDVHLHETCPVSTEGWTRRVHFVREGGGG